MVGTGGWWGWLRGAARATAPVVGPIARSTPPTGGGGDQASQPRPGAREHLDARNYRRCRRLNSITVADCIRNQHPVLQQKLYASPGSSDPGNKSAAPPPPPKSLRPPVPASPPRAHARTGLSAERRRLMNSRSLLFPVTFQFAEEIYFLRHQLALIAVRKHKFHGVAFQ